MATTQDIVIHNPSLTKDNLSGALDPEKLLPAEVKESLARESQELLLRIDDATTKSELLGVVTQMSTIKERNSNLLKARFKEVIAENPNRKELDDNMDTLQEQLSEMDPEKLGRLNIVAKLFSRNPLAKRLKKMVQGYESAEKKVEAIENGIAQGARNLISDTNELLTLHDSLDSQNQEIAPRVYVLGGVSRGLLAKKDEEGRTPDVRFEHSLDVAVQDMKLMFLVNSQFKESIMMTVTNNQDLVKGSERLASMATNMVRSGLMLQAALMRQKQVIQRNNTVKEFLVTLMDSNSKTIKENTIAAAQATSGPLLDVERVKESYRVLRDTALQVEDLRQRTMQESKRVADTIDQVTADLKALPGIKGTQA